MISSISAGELSTSALTAARGLSRTRATSISPPSFFNDCRFSSLRFVEKKALFSQMDPFPSGSACSDAVCGGACVTSGVPSSLMNLLSGSLAVSLVAATVATRRMSSAVTSVELVV